MGYHYHKIDAVIELGRRINENKADGVAAIPTILLPRMGTKQYEKVCQKGFKGTLSFIIQKVENLKVPEEDEIRFKMAIDRIKNLHKETKSCWMIRKM